MSSGLVFSPLLHADEIDDLKAQLQKLQAQVEALQSKRQETEQAQPAPQSNRNVLHNIVDGIEISGAIEVETFHTENASLNDSDDSGDNSDIAVATVELGIDAAITKNVSGHLLFLYEEDDTDFGIDEATITISDLFGSPLSFTAGRLYVPFGNFTSNMVSDPLTLELAETSETVFQVAFESENGPYASGYVFNGDAQEADDDDQIEGFGANLGFAGGDDNFGYDLGLSFINNIADSDGLTGEIDDNVGAGDLDDKVNGWGAHVVTNIGSIQLIGEYISATDDFEVGELDGSDKKREPSAWNVEAAYNFTVANRDATIAVGYQESDDFIAQPEKAILLSMGLSIFDNTSLSFELKRTEDYSTTDGGTSDDADTATMQLAVEF